MGPGVSRATRKGLAAAVAVESDVALSPWVHPERRSRHAILTKVGRSEQDMGGGGGLPWLSVKVASFRAEDEVEDTIEVVVAEKGDANGAALAT